MSFPTKRMGHTDDAAQHAMSVSLAQQHLPQMLRQSNYLGAANMCTAQVNFRVKPHAESAPPAMLMQREHELYPTQSSSQQQPSQHVLYPTQSAGDHAALDSEIRTGASADATSVVVMRQMQDHATLLRDNAKLLSATQAKHKETNVLTHKICSQMHQNAQQQSTALDECKDTIAKLKARQSTSVGLMHDICSELHNGLLEHGDDRQSLQRDVSLLQQKDVVAQALLGKMLTMLDQHESVVSKDKGMSDEHLALLDGMCAALEKTKSKLRTFEEAQQEMHTVLADFKANKLGAGAYATEAMEAKLDRYMRVNKDIDGRCTEALQQHAVKVQEMHRAQELALHEQRMKMQQLERAHQQSMDEQHSKMQMLERKIGSSQSEQRKIADLEGRVQELALLQLNSSQGASISRVTERDVKHLQHEMKQIRSLRQDVDRVSEATSKLQVDSNARNEHSLSLHKDVQQVKSTVSGLALGQQTAAADKSMQDSKMLDMRRDMTLEKIRVDKTATSIHNIEYKLAA